MIKEQIGHKSEVVMLYKKSNLQQKRGTRLFSVLPKEMDAIRASQSKMIEREEKLEKKRKPSATITSTEGVCKKSKSDEGDDEKNKDETKSDTKEGNVKLEVQDEDKPNVVLDKKKGLDVHVPISAGNMIDFQSLQGLINIHFHFHNK